MSTPVIRADGISKRYRIGVRKATTVRDAVAGLFSRRRTPDDAKQIWALRDVSFGVAEGEVVGLVGRNGAGKSTLLKILSRITRPTVGVAELRGRVGNLLEVGVGFHQDLTGRENVYLNGAILGMPRRDIDRKFDEIVAFAETARFLDTPVKHYSSGMYMRLAFAVAAHLDSEILVVDEVLAVGDAAFQKKCLTKMHDLASAGRTVMFVSHNLLSIQHLCNRALLIDGGRLVDDGSVSDVIRKYERLLGGNATSAASNLILATSTDTEHDFDISKIEVLDPEGQPKPRVETGDDLVIRITIRAARAIDPASVELIISTSYGADLIQLVTDLVPGFRLSIPAGVSTIDCRVAKLPLVPGIYNVGAGIAEANRHWLFRNDYIGKLTIAVPANIRLVEKIGQRALVAVGQDWIAGGSVEPPG